MASSITSLRQAETSPFSTSSKASGTLLHNQISESTRLFIMPAKWEGWMLSVAVDEEHPDDARFASHAGWAISQWLNLSSNTDSVNVSGFSTTLAKEDSLTSQKLAKVGEVNRFSYTALGLACANRSLACVRMLLRHAWLKHRKSQVPPSR
jgi:hypothetical protein